MFTTILVVSVILVFAAAYGEKTRRDHQLKLIEAKKQSQLALDGQRYEKIREILTDGLIGDQPAAVEVLKPLVEVIADQMRGETGLELKELERKHELALAKTQTKPLDSWLEKLEDARRACTDGFGNFDEEAYELIVDKMTESTQKVFGTSLQQSLPAAEEKKSLPKPTNGQ